MARSILVVLAVAALAGGCGSRGDGTTALRLSGSNSWVGRATFTLRCNPPGGDIAAPARACAALAQHSDVLFRPLPANRKGGSQSWWDLTLKGRYKGRRVLTRVGSCWSPQMELIGSLGIYGQLRAHVLPHSRPRRHLARPYAGAARRACLHFWNQTPDRSRRRLAVLGAPYRRASLGAHATVVRGRMTLRGCEYLFYGSRNLRVQVTAGERAGRLLWRVPWRADGVIQAAAAAVALGADGRLRLLPRGRP